MRVFTLCALACVDLVWSQSPQPNIAKWDAALEQATKNDSFAGAVLIARNGKPIFRRAYGLADREQNIPNRPETKFRIGSMNKMFTAVVISQLAQRGKLRFSDHVNQYIRDYPNKDLASRVTIEHLLTHTGGTGDIFGPDFVEHRSELNTLADYLTLYGKRGLAYPPRTKWAYSNYGFILLGLIVERVTGQSYYDYVREHVFKPAGMESTDSMPESTTVPDLSIGYTRRGGGPLRPNTDTLPPRGTSAGGGYSTVDDLMRFSQALLNHRLLDQLHTEQLTKGRVTAGYDIQYGHGFFVQKRWFGHGGGAPGMNGELRIYPESHHFVAVLANTDPPAAANIAIRIGDDLLPR